MSNNIIISSILIALQIIHSYYSFGQEPSNAVFGQNEKIVFSFEGHIYYLPPETQELPLSFDKKDAIGTLYTNKLNIPSRPFSSGFPGITDRFEWFAIEYNGTFYCPEEGEMTFILESDDGSKLFIDNNLIVDNDGIHGTEMKFGNTHLSKGFHSIQVQYFQGPREVISLTLRYKYRGKSFRIFNIEDFRPANVSKKDDGSIEIEINSELLFDFDKYLLKKEAENILSEIANVYLKDTMKAVVIVGFTDNRGSKVYNKILSEKRAVSVKTFLESNVSNRNFFTIGRGEENPKHLNTTEEGMRKNRRVEIYIMDKRDVQHFLDQL